MTFGILEPQAAGPFSNASFTGAYVLGTENPSASTVTTESGVLTADGKANAAGTVDQSSPTGLMQNQSLNLTYSFPANGVGNVGKAGDVEAYCDVLTKVGSTPRAGDNSAAYEPTIVLGTLGIQKEQILRLSFAGYVLGEVQGTTPTAGHLVTVTVD